MEFYLCRLAHNPYVAGRILPLPSAGPIEVVPVTGFFAAIRE
jgi:hypothetical protein